VFLSLNVCPFAIRLAWHASGTYDASDHTGGSDGATMRFDPEINDGANAGLALMQDILKPVQAKFKDLSVADVWTLAGAQAVALTGGPAVPFRLGRTDSPDGSACPPVGRLPDATQGAQHLRDVFYRMGFGDKEIVALSGAHTLGSCHRLRSGFDGACVRSVPTAQILIGSGSRAEPFVLCASLTGCPLYLFRRSVDEESAQVR
jgi:catalase (peroxidase I)